MTDNQPKQVKQRSPEWFAGRVGRVTASNVGAILGLDPFRTAANVMQQMLLAVLGIEQDQKDNPALAYGIFHENGARVEYEITTGRTVLDAGFVVHPEHNWLGASPDGFVGNDGIIEIKCPYSKRRDDQPVFAGISETEQPHYYAQVQTQLFCTGLKWCDFYQWAPKGNHLTRVYADEEWWNKTFPRLKEFCRQYILKVATTTKEELLQEVQRPVIATDHVPRIAQLVEEYDQVNETLELAEQRKKDILAELIKLSGERNSEICGRKLTKVNKKGAINYAKIVKEHLPELDLDKYRGKSFSYWQLK